MVHPAKKLLLALATCPLLLSCNNIGKPSIDLRCSLPQINTVAPAKSENLNIALYVDGSGSMLGYIKNKSSNYIQALEVLNDVVDDADYYRIGDKKKLTRSDYLKAKTAEFYDGTNPKYPKVSSPIHEALTSPPPGGTEQLLILVTDLEQNEGDVDRITEAIQAKYLNKPQGYAVGVWAVKSQFSGSIYGEDGRPLFAYNTEQTKEKKADKYRPFYILFIGQPKTIKYYFDKLNNFNPQLLQNSHLLLFSPDNIIKQAISLPNRSNLPKLPPELPPEVERQFTLSDANVSVSVKNPNTEPYEMLEVIDPAKDIEIKYNIPLSRVEYGLPIAPDNLKTKTRVLTFQQQDNSKKDTSQKQDNSEEDTSKQRDNSDQDKENPFQEDNNSNLKQGLIIEFDNGSVSEEQPSLTYTATIKVNQLTEPKIYLFEVDLIAKNLQEPDWWEEWDWQTRDNQQDGSKTHNLSRFMRKLQDETLELIANDNNEAVIGRLCYAIQK